MNKYFCNAPFRQIEITPTGSCRVCCKMPSVMVLGEDDEEVKVQNTILSEIWKNDWLNDFRQRNINEEKRPECQQCWDDEEAGNISLRMQTNVSIHATDQKDPKIKDLVLKLSNKCNCACRICCFWLSSLWETEIKKSGRWDKNHDIFSIQNSRDKLTGKNTRDWQSILHGIEKLLIYGGEPLLNEEVLEILNYLVDRKLSKNISLILNTNGTVMNDKFMNIFNQFQQVYLYFSIDDVFERYNYERWPAKYDNIFRDLQLVHDKYERGVVQASLYISVSIFNVLDLNEIFKEFKKFPKFTINIDNLIFEPFPLSIYNLPTEIKDKVALELDKVDWNQNWEDKSRNHRETIKNFLKLYNKDYTFKEYEQHLDRALGVDDLRRKQNWRETFPKLYNLLTSGDKS